MPASYAGARTTASRLPMAQRRLRATQAPRQAFPESHLDRFAVTGPEQPSARIKSFFDRTLAGSHSVRPTSATGEMPVHSVPFPLVNLANPSAARSMRTAHQITPARASPEQARPFPGRVTVVDERQPRLRNPGPLHHPRTHSNLRRPQPAAIQMTMSTPTDPTSPDLPEAPRQRLGNELPPPPSAADQQDVLWQKYQAQFCSYDRAATRSRYGYTTLNVISLAVAAAVPVLAATRGPAGLTASLAAVVAVIEGLAQLFQLQTKWISYRASADALRQHAFFYAAQVDPCTDPRARRDQLAAFLREATTKENTAG